MYILYCESLKQVKNIPPVRRGENDMFSTGFC